MSHETQRDNRAGPLLIAGAWAVGVGAIGGWVTDLTPWYRGLSKPAWQPPDWLFAPAWAVIFVLAALAGAAAWRGAITWIARRRIGAVFLLNALCNIAWSVLFFQLQRPDWALIEVCALWASIIWMIWAVAPYGGRMTWCLLPYLAWVSFAAVLNAAIVYLNAPFH